VRSKVLDGRFELTPERRELRDAGVRALLAQSRRVRMTYLRFGRIAVQP